MGFGGSVVGCFLEDSLSDKEADDGAGNSIDEAGCESGNGPLAEILKTR